MMINTEKIKQYFWFIFGIVGMTFFWVGIWDGLGEISYLKNSFICLFVGIVLIALAGFIFRGANPFGAKETKEIHHVLRKIHAHPQKHEFDIKYHDNIRRKQISINGAKLHHLEKEYVVFLEKGKKEVFVPYHRVKEILHKDKNHWKA